LLNRAAASIEVAEDDALRFATAASVQRSG
jgi:hypothetical protein